MARLERLLKPGAIAVIGGGAWCESVIRECRALGFAGPIWPVHPTKSTLADHPAVGRIQDLPGIPDAVYIGVNRQATVDCVRALSDIGAGGAVCFASGFEEAKSELRDGTALQAALLSAAGSMPILGPNCYGLVNGLDRIALWPDMHGVTPCDSGVAIVTQSSNLAINFTMQTGGPPIAYVVTAGNQAQTGMAEIGQALLADPRVTALGLHIEGIGDLAGFVALAEAARSANKPVVVLKVGRSPEAQAAMVSHTASIAGSDAGARALFTRLGFGQTSSPVVFLETLKLLHVTGGLSSQRIASMSCSGGEAALMADLGAEHGLEFPPLNAAQSEGLRKALGPKVALANPLDYHTYIWGDTEAMAATFQSMMLGDLALGCVVLDYPRPDRFEAPDWDRVIEAMGRVQSRAPMAVLSTMPGTLPEPVAQAAMSQGIVPLAGADTGMAALSVAAAMAGPCVPNVLCPLPANPPQSIDEADAKAQLSAYGVPVPPSEMATTPDQAVEGAERIGLPVVLKGTGLAHKTEAGAVALNLRSEAEIRAAFARMPSRAVLVEGMVNGGLAELLVAILRDPAHGFVLTLGAGGTLTEIMADSTHLLVPAPRAAIRAALGRLRIAPLLAGYRGAPPVPIDAVLDTIEAVQRFVIDHPDRLYELEINPLICTQQGCVAADALLTLGEPP